MGILLDILNASRSQSKNMFFGTLDQRNPHECGTKFLTAIVKDAMELWEALARLVDIFHSSALIDQRPYPC